MSLDSGWRFLRANATGAEAPAFNDSSWTATSVPHTWNAADGQDGGANYYRGVGWYRKHVTPSSALAGKRLGLDNVVAVKVANASYPDVAPLTADFTFFGGIYRSVSLVGVDRLRQGANVVKVSGSRGGQAYTDTATWTLG